MAPKKIVTINLEPETKRKQLEAAYEIPPPGKLLAMNSVLYENMNTSPAIAAMYFDLLRTIRVLGAISADDKDVCDHRLMEACIKQQKLTSTRSPAEQLGIEQVVDLLKQRKAKEAVLERLKINLETASDKFHKYQAMLAKIDHQVDDDNEPAAKKPKLGG